MEIINNIIDNHAGALWIDGDYHNTFNYQTQKNLSIEAKQRLLEWNKDKKQIEREDWHTIFMNMAFNIAQRSTDARTKCGAVLVNKDKEVVAMGFNGILRDVNEKIFANYRAAKYPFYIHSELNCILNCSRQGKSCLDTIMYVSNKPCLNCIQASIQAGITKIIYPQGLETNMTKNDPDYNINLEIILWAAQDKFSLKELQYD